MPHLENRARTVLKHPVRFALKTLKSFQKNRGLLLAGAVAYNALLSLVPLIILSVVVLSQIIDETELIQTLGHYLEWLVPSQSKTVMGELQDFLAYRTVIGWMLAGTMLFFSSLAFSVLESAISSLFNHRHEDHQRHFLVSVLLPYCYVMLLGIGLLFVTVASSYIQVIGSETIHILGRQWSLSGVPGLLLYLIGLGGEIVIVSSIYLVMPVGQLEPKHALIGSIVPVFLWEIIRHILVWYFSNLSQVGVVYGSLTTAIVVLLSLEIAAGLLLLGAQIISEYEQLPDD